MNYHGKWLILLYEVTLDLWSFPVISKCSVFEAKQTSYLLSNMRKLQLRKMALEQLLHG